MTTPDRIMEIVRRSLEEGHAVEIEGLGTFRATLNGRYRLSPQARPQVFVSYVTEDLPVVRRLCEALRKEGCSPWLDRDELLPGQNWSRAITRAIQVADAFVACFSTCASGKRGQFPSELRTALRCAQRQPLDTEFIIPVRLEDCVVPQRIAAELQYVDLFADWDGGIQRIVRAVRKAAKRRPVPGLTSI